jgi:hypothetical protein
MQGRIGLLLAGAALAIGGGVAGAVVVAPALVDDEQARVAGFDQAAKEERATPQHTFQVAKKARSMARAARQLVNGTLPQVDQALLQSQEALNAANTANGRLDAQKVVSATVSGQASVSTDGYSQDPASTGPTVNVTVPESGQIEVFASALFQNSGAIGLFEDGNPVPMQQDGACTGGSPGPDDALIAELVGLTPPALYMSTGTVFGLGGFCGNIGNAGPTITLKRPPGPHTYELRYATCGCGPNFDVSERTLAIAPRP